MSDNMQPQQQAMARPNWRQRNVPPQHLAATQQHLPPQAVPRQLPARPPLHASVTSPNLLSVIPQQQQQQHQPPQQPQQQNNINSNSSSLSRGEVGTVPMQWSGKQAAGTQSAVQPTIGPRPLATDWHGSETVQPRLVRSKSVYGGGDTIRLLRQNQELQERIAKSEQSFEDERRNHVLAIRSLEGSLQDQRSHLQEERKVSGALNRELVQLRAELLAKKKIYEQHSLTMSVSQREQLAKELKELRTRLTEVQRCISPFKSMAGSLGRSPSGENSLVSGSALLSNLRRANQQLASVSAQLASQRPGADHNSAVTDEDVLAEIHDLVQLDGAVSEREIVRHLERRAKHHHNVTMLGPVTIYVNTTCHGRRSHEASTSPLSAFYDPLPANARQLCSLIQSVVSQLHDGAGSENIVLSGECGSGKTFVSHLLSRLLFENLSDGLQAEPFKHFATATTVLHPMISAPNVDNVNSTRVGLVTEFQLTCGNITRTRFHPLLLNQVNVLQSSKGTSLYRILYLMVAAMTVEDKAKLQIESLSQDSLTHLVGPLPDYTADVSEEYSRWKLCLARLGIPIPDVMRVLMSVILLGGIQFVLDTHSGSQLDVKGNGNELKIVASLLGVSPVTLYQGLTTRTRLIRGQSLRSCSDAIAANNSRDALAQSLYIRTLNAIVRRVNTMKQRQPPPPPKRKPAPAPRETSLPAEPTKTRRTASENSYERSLPSIPQAAGKTKQPRSPPELPPPPPLVDSRDSATPPQKLSRDSSRPSSRPTDEQLSQKRPSVDTVIGLNLKLSDPPSKPHAVAGGSKSAPVSTSSGGLGQDGTTSATATSPLAQLTGTQTVSIMDLFGFQNSSEPSQGFQQLCCNITAEALQQQFQSSIFKKASTACKLERVDVLFEAEYDDRSECFQLFSEQNGIFSLMTKECSMPRFAVENFIGKISSGHGSHPCFAGAEVSPASFSIRHFHDKITYDASHVLEANRDTIADDIVCIFHKQNCNFGFVGHLFSSETKSAGGSSAGSPSPRGVQHRISPPATTSESGEPSVASLVFDYQTKLDALLYTLDQRRAHYVHCIKASGSDASIDFDEGSVVRQLRRLDVSDSLAMFKFGYSCQWSIEQFNARFLCVASSRCQKLKGAELSAGILKSIDTATLANPSSGVSLTADAVSAGSATSVGAATGKTAADAKTSNRLWAVGEQTVFFSEVTFQHLEHRRDLCRERSIVKLQSLVRRWLCIKKWPEVKKNRIRDRKCGSTTLNGSMTSLSDTMSAVLAQVDHDSATCLFAADRYSPPSIPKTRPYTVVGNIKVGFPQARKMTKNYPEFGDPLFIAGQEVHLVGVSTNRRGYMLIAKGDNTIEVPHRFTKFEKHSIAGEAVSLI